MLKIIVGSVALVVTFAGPVLAQPTTAVGQPTALLHGNYCGPGNNAPAAPIDALDAACAKHDACTPDGRIGSKACNLRLQREAEAISRDPGQPDDLRALAGIVSVGASMMLAGNGPDAPPSLRSAGSRTVLANGTR